MLTSLAVVLALGLAGLGAGFGAPVALLAWLALMAPAGGAWMGRWARSPLAWAPPLVWVAALFLTRGVPSPLPAALVVLSLYAAGMGLGAWLSAERAAGAALLIAAGLSLAPALGGTLESPWPAVVTARLLDASPVAWVAESAGIDWMRHPAVYETAGTADIGPDLRTGRRGWLAAVCLLVVGCVFALLAEPRKADPSNP
jgi:hypothetical protein